MQDYEKQAEDPVDQDLEYVRIKRKGIIDHLTKTGVPDDDERISLLLGALNDMDRTSLGKKRIKVDSDASTNNKQAADLIANIFNMPDSKKLGLAKINGIMGTIPNPDSQLPTVEVLPGEMAINPPQLDYNAFMSSDQK